jgi:hypothetical protein
MKTKIMHSLAALMVIAFALTGCFDVPPSLYTPVDPDEENAKTPRITVVDKSAMWTDDTLTISGENFSDSLEWNFVYFFESNEPTVGDTSVAVDSMIVDGSYNLLTALKDITITSSGYRTTITTVMDHGTVSASYLTPTLTEEYTLTDSTTLILTSIATRPVFDQIDTTWLNDTTIASIDTTGHTVMVRTITTFDEITNWVSHTGRLGTVVEASPTELKVIPPQINAIQSKIIIHVQDAIAPGRWGYIDLFVKP